MFQFLITYNPTYKNGKFYHNVLGHVFLSTTIFRIGCFKHIFSKLVTGISSR